MTTRILCCVLLALGAAACSSVTIPVPNPMAKPQPDPPLWSATYDVPYTVMANCLAAQPISGFTGVPRIQPEAGTATVTLALGDGTQLAINYIIQRTGSGTSMVSWRRHLTVGGWEPIDSDARTRADTCGGVS